METMQQQAERLIDEKRRLIETLEEVAAWNAADLRGFDDISPDEAMLRARARVLRKAIKQAKGE